MPRTRNPVILTDREETVLKFIKQYRAEKGYSPSMREIAHHLHVDSTSLVHFYLSNLERAGVIHRDPNVSRSIVMMERG